MSYLEQNHSVATVNSLVPTPVLLMDVSRLKMSQCIFNTFLVCLLISIMQQIFEKV